jgi:hypothetical protein
LALTFLAFTFFNVMIEHDGLIWLRIKIPGSLLRFGRARKEALEVATPGIIFVQKLTGIERFHRSKRKSDDNC